MRLATTIACLLACAACQKSTQPPSADTIPPKPSVGAPTEADQASEKSPEELALEKVGQACVVDHTCPLYLRCVQSKCAVPGAISGVKDERTPIARFRPRGDAAGSPISFFLELATDDKQRARGLMYRRSILPDWGMLFVYGANRELSFWMKNTYIPLDMVFIDQRGVVVGILEGVPPLTLDPRTVGKPARYVLELGSGIAAKSGLKAGMRMTLERSPREEFQPYP